MRAVFIVDRGEVTVNFVSLAPSTQRPCPTWIVRMMMKGFSRMMSSSSRAMTPDIICMLVSAYLSGGQQQEGGRRSTSAIRIAWGGEGSTCTPRQRGTGQRALIDAHGSVFKLTFSWRASPCRARRASARRQAPRCASAPRSSG